MHCDAVCDRWAVFLRTEHWVSATTCSHTQIKTYAHAYMCTHPCTHNRTLGGCHTMSSSSFLLFGFHSGVGALFTQLTDAPCRATQGAQPLSPPPHLSGMKGQISCLPRNRLTGFPASHNLPDTLGAPIHCQSLGLLDVSGWAWFSLGGVCDKHVIFLTPGDQGKETND